MFRHFVPHNFGNYVGNQKNMAFYSMLNSGLKVIHVFFVLEAWDFGVVPGPTRTSTRHTTDSRCFSTVLNGFQCFQDIFVDSMVFHTSFSPVAFPKRRASRPVVWPGAGADARSWSGAEAATATIPGPLGFRGFAQKVMGNETQEKYPSTWQFTVIFVVHSSLWKIQNWWYVCQVAWNKPFEHRSARTSPKRMPWRPAPMRMPWAKSWRWNFLPPCWARNAAFFMRKYWWSMWGGRPKSRQVMALALDICAQKAEVRRYGQTNHIETPTAAESRLFWSAFCCEWLLRPLFPMVSFNMLL